jgi:CHAD domain-containing protein
MRIAAKKLRYTLEAFESALEPGATLIQEVTALQDAAGEMHDAIVAADRAGSDVRPRDLSADERSATEAFAEAQRRRAAGLRPQIRTRLRTVRSRAFRETLGRAAARMGHAPT